jgi:hypothetical protein
LLTRADLQTQVDGIRATAYPRAHGNTFDIATGGSTAEPVTVRRTALTQLFWLGSDSTRCRIGTCGMTWSTRCAVVCDIRRASHDGHKPRRLR